VNHSTIYVADNDLALKLSKEYNDEDPVGLRPPTVRIKTDELDDIDIVDASGVSCQSSSDICHSYHLSSPYMRAELRVALKGASPYERGLIQKDLEGISYFDIKPN
jgi:hypothetical protein